MCVCARARSACLQDGSSTLPLLTSPSAWSQEPRVLSCCCCCHRMLADPPCFTEQVLEGWEPQEYGHYLDQVEAAITAAVQDALGETRTNGRTAFAAYASALPDRASALLKRFDSGLQQKLHEAVVAYGKGHAGEVSPGLRFWLTGEKTSLPVC